MRSVMGAHYSTVCRADAPLQLTAGLRVGLFDTRCMRPYLNGMHVSKLAFTSGMCRRHKQRLPAREAGGRAMAERLHNDVSHGRVTGPSLLLSPSAPDTERAGTIGRPAELQNSPRCLKKPEILTYAKMAISIVVAGFAVGPDATWRPLRLPKQLCDAYITKNWTASFWRATTQTTLTISKNAHVVSTTCRSN